MYELENAFFFFEVTYVPREENFIVDILSKFANIEKLNQNKTTIQETLATPITKVIAINPINTLQTKIWMSPIVRYLTDGKISLYEEEKKGKMVIYKIRVGCRIVAQDGKTTLMIRCLGEDVIILVLMEVQKGVWGSHIGVRALHK